MLFPFDLIIKIIINLKFPNWSIHMNWGWTEIISCIAEVAMALAAWYGLFSLKSWISQSTISRRADIAKDALEELEFFYLRLEQLVHWEYLLDWIEWGRSFNDILRTHFLPAKLKAERLKDDSIYSLLEKMEKTAITLPSNQRLATQVVEGTGQLFWPKEEPKAKDKFDSGWQEYQKNWQMLRQSLLKEALYDLPKKSI